MAGPGTKTDEGDSALDSGDTHAHVSLSILHGQYTVLFDANRTRETEGRCASKFKSWNTDRLDLLASNVVLCENIE